MIMSELEEEVREYLAALRAQFDQLDARFGQEEEVREYLAALRAQFDQLDARFGQLEQAQQDRSAAIADLQAKLLVPDLDHEAAERILQEVRKLRQQGEREFQEFLGIRASIDPLLLTEREVYEALGLSD
jgi:signal recognition particle GTPase